MRIGSERRDDIVVSLCLVSDTSQAIDAALLQRIAEQLSASFRYWEILVGVPADEAHTYENLLTTTTNLRILKIRVGVPFYRRRIAVAQEAIGDIVLFTATNELLSFDFVELIDACDREDAILIGRRRQRSFINPALIWLGRNAGFRVDERDMLTAVFPRAPLNQILSHSERDLALRFPPQDDSMPVQWQLSKLNDKRERSYRELKRRFGLVHKLIVSSAPRVLTLASFVSAVVTVLSVAFGVYAVVVWLTMPDVQPGWFTTSIIQSLTATFLAWAIFGLSIGIQKVLETITGDIGDDVVGERSAIDMFEHVFHDLNVNLEQRDTAESVDRSIDARREGR